MADLPSGDECRHRPDPAAMVRSELLTYNREDPQLTMQVADKLSELCIARHSNATGTPAHNPTQS